MKCELNPTISDAAAHGRGGGMPSGRKAGSASNIGSDPMSYEDTRVRLGRDTPGAAAQRICKRLQGACNDPVKYERKGDAYEFTVNRMPVATLVAYSDSADGYYVDVYQMGRTGPCTYIEFMDSWYPNKHPRKYFSFAVHSPNKPIQSYTKRESYKMRAAPKMHAMFPQELNDGPVIRNYLQSMFGNKLDVVHARFTVKYVNQSEKGEPGVVAVVEKRNTNKKAEKKIKYVRMYTTFWVSNKMLYAYDRNIKVEGADGSAVKNPTFTERLEANDAANAERNMPRMAPVARLVAQRGGVAFTEDTLRESRELCNSFFDVVPQYAGGSDGTGRRACNVETDREQTLTGRAVYALHAFYHDVLSADDTPKRRVRRAPRAEAAAAEAKPKGRDACTDTLQRHDDDAAATANRTTVVSYQEFMELVDAEPNADMTKLPRYKEVFAPIAGALRAEGMEESELYMAMFAVANRYHVNTDVPPKASIGAMMSPAFNDTPRFFSEAAPSSWGSAPGEYETTLEMDSDAPVGGSFTNGTVTIGNSILETLSAPIRDERDEYERNMAAWERVNMSCARLAAVIGKVRHMAFTNEFRSSFSNDDKKYNADTVVVGGVTFANKKTKAGRLIAKIVEADSSRMIELAKKGKRDSQKDTVKADKQQLADAEAGAGSGKGRKGRKRSARNAGAAKDAAADKADGSDSEGEGECESIKVSDNTVVPVRLDVMCRALGPNFRRGVFKKVCEATKRATLEKFAHKHVTFFESKGWDCNENKKIVIMLSVIKENGWTLPADYKPKAKSGKPGRPRKAKKQHANRAGAGNGAASGGRRAANNGFNRKHAPQTGSTSGLGNSS